MVSKIPPLSGTSTLGCQYCALLAGGQSPVPRIAFQVREISLECHVSPAVVGRNKPVNGHLLHVMNLLHKCAC
jgi:hypothetical protein